jgi:hypothetical protein
MEKEEGIGSTKEEPITLKFPIWEPRGLAQMKNISPSALPNFNSLASEDPKTFLF